MIYAFYERNEMKMKNFKQIIAKQISDIIKIDEKELEQYIETPKDTKNGDYSFPCFKLAKELKKAPQIIATEIKEKLEAETSKEETIDKIDVAGAYINFYINKKEIAEEVLKEVENTEQYGKSEIGKGKKNNSRIFCT